MIRPLPAFSTALALFGFALTGCVEDSAETADEAYVTAGPPEGTPKALAVLAMVNDRAVTIDALKGGKVTSTAAKNIVARRNGKDGAPRTADDHLFETIRELDGVSQVGPATFTRLEALADKLGYVDAQEAKERSVIFSPQSFEKSHNAEIAKLIATAEHSLDIAMYSFSDAGIQNAIAAAIQRGVKVRFLFDTASEDRKLTGTALTSSKSGKLESNGADVRWVNKIMHHKFMLVDGPRDDIGRASDATVVTGSGNWSNGAATKYDENTLFLKAYPEMTLRMQREFEHLWTHSRDLAANPSLVFESGTAVIEDTTLPEDPGIHAFFTSDNFKVTTDTFSVVAGSNRISDELVRAINGAEDRIHIASGHLRSRPVSEALIKKHADDPSVDIMVYLDGQEYVSESADSQQVAELDACLLKAKTPSQQNSCRDSGFLFGLSVGRSGIDVRYKYYAYRWDASYAAQMHNKFLIVDDSLYTGSYNLSDNAEHNTFENMLLFKGPEFRDLVKSYEDRFQSMWRTGEGKLDAFRTTIDQATTIPIVFDALSLTWSEVRDLKALIAKECPLVNSAAFRDNAPAHQTCTK